MNEKWGLPADSISRAPAFCPAVNLSNLTACSMSEIRTSQKRLSVLFVLVPARLAFLFEDLHLVVQNLSETLFP